jgi:hypothetical protein
MKMNITNLISVSYEFVNISVEVDNEKVFFDGGIIPLLFPLIDSSDINVWQHST